MVSEEEVWNALREVVDPEIGANLVDLGLIYEVRVDNGKDVYVKMTLTVPGCPLMTVIPAQVEERIKEIDGVDKVTVQLTFDPPWTPDRMSKELRELYGW
ncbi:MAG: metal-sulfur cluster assembly factor [Euryarchaeota archaeon]|nr:metal-sulfur cluster assembly factor [Euryarchaeota archaeon]